MLRNLTRFGAFAVLAAGVFVGGCSLPKVVDAPPDSTEGKMVGVWESDILPVEGIDADFFTGKSYRIDLFYSVPHNQPDAVPTLWGNCFCTMHEKPAVKIAGALLDTDANWTHRIPNLTVSGLEAMVNHDGSSGTPFDWTLRLDGADSDVLYATHLDHNKNPIMSNVVLKRQHGKIPGW